MFQQKYEQQHQKPLNKNKGHQLYDFNDRNKLVRALSNKIQELEYKQKYGRDYKFGNNEELIGMGQQLLEFFFFDHMIYKGYPNPATQIKKMGDIIIMRQKLLQEKNISELAVYFKVHQYIQAGKQISLRQNPKVQAETFKALLGAHYLDFEQDLDSMRELMTPIISLLLEKNQHLDLNDVKVNSKSQFYEFLNDHQEIKPKLSLEWDKITQLDGTTITNFTYQMYINNDQLFLKETGINKRETEQKLFKNALQKIKSELRNQLYSTEKQKVSRINKNLNDSSFLLDDDQLTDKSHYFIDQSEIPNQNIKTYEFNIDKMLEGLINE